MEVRAADDMRAAARRLLDTGCRAVLVKGGHLPGAQVNDLLIADGLERTWPHTMLEGRFHGTGCTLSAATAAALARGEALQEAVDTAIHFVQDAMLHGRLPQKGDLVLLAHYFRRESR